MKKFSRAAVILLLLVCALACTGLVPTIALGVGNFNVIGQPVMPSGGIVSLATAPSGMIYGATANGHLFSYNPASGVQQDLGSPYPYWPAWISTLIMSSDGKVYGGNTMGRVFSYDPNTTQFHDYGNPLQGTVDYSVSRLLAASDGYIYGGTAAAQNSTHAAHLFRLSQSGFQDLGRASIPDDYICYMFEHGGKIYATTSITPIETPNGNNGHVIYFDTNNLLGGVQDAGRAPITGAFGIGGILRPSGIVAGGAPTPSSTSGQFYGTYWTYNPVSGQFPTPVPTNLPTMQFYSLPALAVDSTDRLFAGLGFTSGVNLLGGVIQVNDSDPANPYMWGQPVPGETQVPALTTGSNGYIYGGTYPSGYLFWFDPSQPPAPTVPTLNGPATSTNGSVLLYGTTTPSTTVEVYDQANNLMCTVTSDPLGSWHSSALLTVQLQQTVYTLSARAILNGSASGFSTPISVTVGTFVPQVSPPTASDGFNNSGTNANTGVGSITSYSARTITIDVPISNTNNISLATVLINGVSTNLSYLLQDPDGDGVYSCTVPAGALPLGPGSYRVTVSLTDSIAGSFSQQVMTITLIDPSGYVYDTTDGHRVEGAQVTLHQFNFAAGVYEVMDPVAKADYMDPDTNPQTTDSQGSYGWLVAPGKYKVLVERAGYSSVWSREVVITDVAVTDLNVGLTPAALPTATIATSPAAPNGNNGWFKTLPAITLSSNQPGVMYYEWDSTSPASAIAYSAGFTASEGIHTLYCWSADTHGNLGPTVQQQFKVDSQVPGAPSITAPANGATLNTRSVHVTGNAEANTTVRIYDGSTEVGATQALGDGNFAVTVTLASGSHNLSAKAQDEAGNLSPASSSVAVTIEQQAGGGTYKILFFAGNKASLAPSEQAFMQRYSKNYGGYYDVALKDISDVSASQGTPWDCTAGDMVALSREGMNALNLDMSGGNDQKITNLIDGLYARKKPLLEWKAGYWLLYYWGLGMTLLDPGVGGLTWPDVNLAAYNPGTDIYVQDSSSPIMSGFSTGQVVKIVNTSGNLGAQVDWSSGSNVLCQIADAKQLAYLNDKGSQYTSILSYPPGSRPDDGIVTSPPTIPDGGSSTFYGRPTEAWIVHMSLNNLNDLTLPGWRIMDNAIAFLASQSPPPSGDIQAPSKPANVHALPIGSSEIDLSWSASTDNVGVTGYSVYNAATDEKIADVTTASYAHLSLAPDSPHTYYIRAYDAVGNLSEKSDIVAAHTYQGSVTTPVGHNINLDFGNNASITFADITMAGMTSVGVLSNAPSGPPFGFLFAGRYIDIATTASYLGDITVTVPYQPELVQGHEDELHLFHWDGLSWQDVTVSIDKVNHVVIGRTPSLSPFAIGYPQPAAVSSGVAFGMNTNMLLLSAIALVIGGLSITRARRAT
ncbi:MAG TPA: Ig-like domain-containing protein [Candidatus Aquicultor sp.]|jgi:hypothetical protein